MKILIAVNSSEEAEYAFRFAKNHYFSDDTTVYLLSVSKEIHPTYSNGDKEAFNSVNESIDKHTANVLTNYAHSLAENNIPHHKIHGKGHVREIICQEAEELKVDLVILGRKEKGILEKVQRPSSTSNYVVHHLHCSVLVIKYPSQTPANSSSSFSFEKSSY